MGRMSHCLIRTEPKLDTSNLVVTPDTVPRAISATFMYLGVAVRGLYGIRADTT